MYIDNKKPFILYIKNNYRKNNDSIYCTVYIHIIKRYYPRAQVENWYSGEREGRKPEANNFPYFVITGWGRRDCHYMGPGPSCQRGASKLNIKCPHSPPSY
jgi:hypothetical protein